MVIGNNLVAVENRKVNKFPRNTPNVGKSKVARAVSMKFHGARIHQFYVSGEVVLNIVRSIARVFRRSVPWACGCAPKFNFLVDNELFFYVIPQCGLLSPFYNKSSLSLERMQKKIYDVLTMKWEYL